MQAKLENYKIFKAVADSHNISTAAKNLYISQSAVSQSIKILEDSLGVRLFSRSQKGVSLTKDGEMLYEYISAALSLIESGEARLNETKELTSGELVIGASNTLTDAYLLPYLNEFHKKFPKVRVRILNGTSKRVTGYLDTGVVDLAFVTTNEKPEKYNSTLCFDTHFVFVAANDYPIDFTKKYTLEELASLPLIMLENEAGSRRFLEDFFLKQGIRLEPEIELASYELLISLAKIGLGVAVVTEELSKKAITNKEVRKLKVAADFPTREVRMLSIANGEPSMAAKKFMELINSPSFLYTK